MFEKFAAGKIDDIAEKILEANKAEFQKVIHGLLISGDIPWLPETAEKPFDELCEAGAVVIYDYIYQAVKAFEPK